MDYMQTVQHVIDELKRFSPDARIDEEISIQSVSPQTICCIAVVGTETTQQRIADLERDNLKLRKELGY